MGPGRAADRRARLLAVVGTALVLVTGCGRVGGEAFQPTHTATLPLGRNAGGAGTLGQSFAPAGQRLAEMDFLTATYGRDLSGRLRVRLRDLDGAVLATAVVEGEAIQENAWTPVRFDPPPQVPAMVTVELDWDGDQPVGLRSNLPPEDPATGASDEGETLENDPYAGGTLHRDGQPVPGDLAFRVVGTRGVAAAPDAVGQVVDHAGTTLGGTPLFTAVWVLLLVLGVALAVAGLMRRERIAGAGADQLDQGRPHEQRGEGQVGRP